MCNPLIFGVRADGSPVCHPKATTRWCYRNAAPGVSTTMDPVWASAEARTEWSQFQNDVVQVCHNRDYSGISERDSLVSSACHWITEQTRINRGRVERNILPNPQTAIAAALPQQEDEDDDEDDTTVLAAGTGEDDGPANRDPSAEGPADPDAEPTDDDEDLADGTGTTLDPTFSTNSPTVTADLAPTDGDTPAAPLGDNVVMPLSMGDGEALTFGDAAPTAGDDDRAFASPNLDPYYTAWGPGDYSVTRPDDTPEPPDASARCGWQHLAPGELTFDPGRTMATIERTTELRFSQAYNSEACPDLPFLSEADEAEVLQIIDGRAQLRFTTDEGVVFEGWVNEADLSFSLDTDTEADGGVCTDCETGGYIPTSALADIADRLPLGVDAPEVRGPANLERFPLGVEVGGNPVDDPIGFGRSSSDNGWCAGDKQRIGRQDEPEFPVLTETKLDNIRRTLTDTYGVPAVAFENALGFYQNNRSSIRNARYMTVLDMTQSGTRKRKFLIDLETGSVTSYFAAHGEGSGEGYNNFSSGRVSLFSDEFENGQSNTSSTPRGFHITGGRSYPDRWGSTAAMILHGQEEGINDASCSRGIFIHRASYISSQNTRNGRGNPGRSWGCPAMHPGEQAEFINKVRDGSVYYIYGGEY
ncbi:MAG: murein L,D-transpeptidase catalytic domain family protein [Bdellovibrionales bacterium]|nr:murein L,D-transpeptidase catalytic domain family protein [Bdellovibrionales bacterium]